MGSNSSTLINKNIIPLVKLNKATAARYSINSIMNNFDIISNDDDPLQSPFWVFKCKNCDYIFTEQIYGSFELKHNSQSNTWEYVQSSIDPYQSEIGEE